MTPAETARRALELDKERTPGEWREDAIGEKSSFRRVWVGTEEAGQTVAQWVLEPDARVIAFAVSNLRGLASALLAIEDAGLEWKHAKCTRMPGCDVYDACHDAECALTLAERGLVRALDALEQS